MSSRLPMFYIFNPIFPTDGRDVDSKLSYATVKADLNGDMMPHRVPI